MLSIKLNAKKKVLIEHCSFTKEIKTNIIKSKKKIPGLSLEQKCSSFNQVVFLLKEYIEKF